MKDANARIYCDPRDPAHLYFSVIRLFDEVSIWVNLPEQSDRQGLRDPIPECDEIRAEPRRRGRDADAAVQVSKMTNLAYTDGN